MKLNRIKRLSSLAVAFVLFAATTISAYAEAFSDWTEKHEYQYTYQFRSGMAIYTHGAYATVYVKSKNGAPIAAGYVGMNAFLFKSNGDLKKSSGMYFNSYPSSSLQKYTSTTDNGTYYARGLVRFYTGTYDSNGPIYNIYNTPPTPLQTYSYNSVNQPSESIDPLSLPNKYSINDKGETYGSALIADATGQYPDLIAAEGISGIRGYVRLEDLDYSPTSLYDAILHTPSLENAIIPVYDINGTIVDTFELTTD